MERLHGISEERKAAKEERKVLLGPLKVRGPEKEERKAAKRAPGGAIAVKRAKLLDELIDAIPMQQLQRAFESPTSPKLLWVLQRKYDFKESNKTIYMELRALFDKRY